MQTIVRFEQLSKKAYETIRNNNKFWYLLHDRLLSHPEIDFPDIISKTVYWNGMIDETEFYKCFDEDWDPKYSLSDDVVRAPTFFQNQITGHIKPVTSKSTIYTGTINLLAIFLT